MIISAIFEVRTAMITIGFDQPMNVSTDPPDGTVTGIADGFSFEQIGPNEWINATEIRSPTSPISADPSDPVCTCVDPAGSFESPLGVPALPWTDFPVTVV